jgi:hypothetical protein
MSCRDKRKRINSMGLSQRDYKLFYDERRQETYAQNYEKMRAEGHSNYPELKAFIDVYQLKGKRCLEIGS